MLESVLVANRGEIARRVIRTARTMGIRAVAVYSDADGDLPYVREADESVHIGPAQPTASYLDAAVLIEAARKSNAAAVHPGYGFLAENADFARRVIEAERVGYPVMVKAAGGGGGIGMGAATDEAGLRAAFETARSRAERFFGSPAILLERYVERARHVEVQILGLADGRVLALGERDCSVQRRHQKVAEETPSPGVSAGLRERMLAAAVQAGEAVGYRGAGTVECLVDAEAGSFVFLEMNTRLQVEHPVTELVTGIDLVEQQFRIAAGEPPSFEPDAIRPAGHAIELRIYAEDPVRFLPGPGTITEWEEPAGDGVRVDAGYQAGNTVTPFYDPLLAKLCTHGADRAQALDRARQAVAAFRIAGPKTNLAFHADLLTSPEFVSGDYDTSLVSKLRPR